MSRCSPGTTSRRPSTGAARRTCRAAATSGCSRIKTDSGLEGHAFLGSATNPAESDAGALIRFLKPILMGKDPLEREELHAAMRARQRNMRPAHRSAPATSRCGTSPARSPACRSTSFSAAARSAIGAYASSQILDGPQAYAEEAAQFKADGWKAYKIHPPQHAGEDIKVCEAVRKAVGDDYTLMLDSTWSYNYHDAAARRPRHRAARLPTGTRTRSTRRTSTPT